MGGHLQRVPGDIGDIWYQDTNHIGGLRGILNTPEINAPLNEYAGLSGWNDPNVLVVGVDGKNVSIGYESEGCAQEQYKSHFSLWRMVVSPLFSGNDVHSTNNSTLRTPLNADLIAIDQDILSRQAEQNVRSDHHDIWVKSLADGHKAVACFNQASSPQTVILDENTITDSLFEQIYCSDNHLTKSGSDSEELIVKLVPY